MLMPLFLLYCFPEGNMYRFLETGSQDADYNLAFEEYVLNRQCADSLLILWQNDRSVIIGKNQNTFAEVNLPYAEENGIAIVRRMTGGGAVYHDLGNINYSLICNATEPFDFRDTLQPILATLHSIGVPAEQSGRNDLILNGKKISGTAACISGGRMLCHGTLLFDTDLDAMAAVLAVDAEKLTAKGIRSVRSRVSNIRETHYPELSAAEFYALLRRHVLESGCVPASLSPADLEEIRTLRERKYAQWDWTFGRSSEADIIRRRRWEEGSLEAALTVDHGSIKEIRFSGDFLAMKELADVNRKLCGVPYERNAVDAALADAPLSLYFGGITKEQILQTLFGD